MNKLKTDEELVLLGGYGENSTLSQALVSLLLKTGKKVAVIARPNTAIVESEDLSVFFGDMNDPKFISDVVDTLVKGNQKITAYIQTAGALTRAPFLATKLTDYSDAMERNFFCSVAVSQKLIAHALANTYEQHLIFLGATGSKRGGKEFSAFCAAKFALRGFTQSLAREFGPQGIHVCHLLVDGIIDGKRAKNIFNKQDEDCIRGTDLAVLIHQLAEQPRSTWTHEIDVRPSNEKF